MMGLFHKALDLLKGRSYVEMLLAIVIASILSGVYWVGNTVIPAQTRQIQEGYERINRDNAERNTERMKIQEDSHQETMRAAVDAFKSASQTFESTAQQSSKREETLMKVLLDERKEQKERE